MECTRAARRLFPLAVALWAAMLRPAPAQATTIKFFADLDGAQEVPPRVTPATGFAEVTYDDVSNLLSWDITFQDLLAPATAAHFHNAPFGVNGPVVVPIGGLAGLTAGNVLGSGILLEALEPALLAENFYINIHTSVFPGGEIRGQVLRAPEAASLMLLALGGLGLLACRPRRRAESIRSSSATPR